MVDILHLSEDNMLTNLLKRYLRRRVYTYSGEDAESVQRRQSRNCNDEFILFLFLFLDRREHFGECESVPTVPHLPP